MNFGGVFVAPSASDAVRPPPGAFDAVNALLAIIADPAIHKQRLDALNDAIAKLDARVDAQAAAFAAQSAEIKQAGEQLDDLRTQAVAAQAQAASNQAAADAARHDLDERAHAFAAEQETARVAAGQRDADLQDKVAAIAAREGAVKQREDACAARESAISDKEVATDAALADAQASRDEYAAKLARLKQITG